MLRRSSTFPLALTLLIGQGLLNGCAVNPATGDADIVLMSEGKEISIGEEMHQELKDKGQFYDDVELQSYVDKIGQRLVAASDRPDLTFTFTVIDSPDINAFAIPGGYIYINRGLLAYLDSEAELAGVLAHEIGHVTGRHAVRQHRDKLTNSILSGMTYILTGSGDVADATKRVGTELVAGYGREMELEADATGAKYMHQAGYDTDALLEVIGVLKDQETYARVRARSSGRPSGTYHGVYSTHPRNDARLQQVIRTAASLDGYPDNPAIPGEFRRQVEGMAYGQSTLEDRDPNRFYHRKLGFSFKHPEDWTVDGGAQAIVTKPPSEDRKLTLTIDRRDRESDTEATLRKQVGEQTLSPPEKLEQDGITGHTAVVSDGTHTRRIAVFDLSGLTYTLTGEVNDQSQFQAADEEFKAIIESFRPMAKWEKQAPREGQTLHYVQVKRGWDIEKLASISPLADAENQLRLLNGFYPKGEPRTGDWIKVVQ